MSTSRTGRLADTPGKAGGGPGYLRTAELEKRFGRPLGVAVGLTQFGVNHVTLAPGAISALRHWHEKEDEFVYVLRGEITLIDEAGEHLLRTGDYAGFPAGEANAHHLVNRSTTEAVYLEAGTRHVGEETVHYPDDPQMGSRTISRGPDGQRLKAGG